LLILNNFNYLFLKCFIVGGKSIKTDSHSTHKYLFIVNAIEHKSNIKLDTLKSAFS
jgi:hypothetical protein